MKKLILIAIAFVGLQVAAQGQRNGGREDHKNLSAEEMATKRTEKMTTDLALNETQKKAVYALNLESSKTQKKRMESRGDNKEKPSEEAREKMKAERKEQRDATNAKLKEILTDEQYAKLESSKKNGKGKGKGKGKKGKKSS